MKSFLTFLSSNSYINRTINYRITGASTSAPLYALNSTTIPTTSNVTVSGNVVTATANSASCATWNYAPGGVITSITPQVKFTPTALTIDPSSTTGNVKLVYGTSGTVSVGSKLITTTSGTTTQITVTAGSETTNSVFSASDGTIDFIECAEDGSLFAMGRTTRRLYRSTDGGFSFYYLATLGGTGSAVLTSVCKFSGQWYAGLCYQSSQSNTINLWGSVNLITWTSQHSATFTNAGSCGVATNGTLLSVTYGGDDSSFQTTLQGYYSTNATTFTVCNSNNVSATQIVIYDYRYTNGKFVVAGSGIICQSSDGITWNNLNIFSGITNQFAATTLYFNGSIYLIGGYHPTVGGIYSSNNFSSWTQRQNISGASTTKLLQNSNTYIVGAQGTTSIYYSTNGTSWNLQTVSGASFPAVTGAYSSISNKFIYGNNGNQLMRYSANGTTWNSQDLATNSGYTFTITSPSISVPNACYLGGQTLDYYVGQSTTPTWATATLSYSDSAGLITVAGGAISVSGSNLQLRVQNLNNADVISYIGSSNSGTFLT